MFTPTWPGITVLATAQCRLAQSRKTTVAFRLKFIRVCAPCGKPTPLQDAAPPAPHGVQHCLAFSTAENYLTALPPAARRAPRGSDPQPSHPHPPPCAPPNHHRLIQPLQLTPLLQSQPARREAIPTSRPWSVLPASSRTVPTLRLQSKLGYANSGFAHQTPLPYLLKQRRARNKKRLLNTIDLRAIKATKECQ